MIIQYSKFKKNILPYFFSHQHLSIIHIYVDEKKSVLYLSVL